MENSPDADLSLEWHSRGLVAKEQVLKGANAFFQDDKVWVVALTVSQENYALIQPKGRKGFGADVEYVRANVLIGGRFYEEGGWRYKGTQVSRRQIASQKNRSRSISTGL